MASIVQVNMFSSPLQQKTNAFKDFEYCKNGNYARSGWNALINRLFSLGDIPPTFRS